MYPWKERYVPMWDLRQEDLQTACCKMEQSRCLPSMWDMVSWTGNLRQDERVVCMEKTNIRYVQPEDLGEPIDFSSIDVSFISLTKVLLPIRNYLKENGEIVALIKPQFEAGREKVGKKGVVREKSTHIEVIEKVTDYAVSIGFEVAALEFSPIKGPEGNIEYLVHLKKRPEEEARIVESVDIRGTVDAAFDTLAKKDPAEEKK